MLLEIYCSLYSWFLRYEYLFSKCILSVYIVVARFSLTIVINFIYGGSIQTTRQQTPRYLSEFPEQKF